MRPPHHVLLVAFDGFQLLDLAGPVEVLRSATRLGADPPYATRVAAPGRRVRSESGVALAADTSLGTVAADATPIDTLVVVGGQGTRAARDDRAFLADLATVAERAGRVTSVCTGAWLLAAAGLLDGYASTTHWSKSARLRSWLRRSRLKPPRFWVLMPRSSSRTFCFRWK